MRGRLLRIGLEESCLDRWTFSHRRKVARTDPRPCNLHLVGSARKANTHNKRIHQYSAVIVVLVTCRATRS